jgi:hypothetical protein
VVVNALEEQYFVDTDIRIGEHNVRPRLSAYVRVNDDVTKALAEAREHAALGRLRAAGCVAGVELERSLKAKCIELQAEVRARLPTISDYNDALKAKRAYRQQTWRTIQVLGDLRNKCAHVLEEEPNDDDVSKLLGGVDEILRMFEAAHDSPASVPKEGREAIAAGHKGHRRSPPQWQRGSKTSSPHSQISAARRDIENSTQRFGGFGRSLIPSVATRQSGEPSRSTPRTPSTSQAEPTSSIQSKA